MLPLENAIVSSIYSFGFTLTIPCHDLLAICTAYIIAQPSALDRTPLLTLKAEKERNAVSFLNSSATPPVPVRVPSVVVHVASERPADDTVVRVAARGADVPPFLPAQKQDFLFQHFRPE